VHRSANVRRCAISMRSTGPRCWRSNKRRCDHPVHVW